MNTRTLILNPSQPEAINARAYGAPADGVTDAAPAINAALAEASSKGIGKVYLPGTPNSYIAASLLSVPSKVELTGDGLFSKIQSTIPAGTSELVRLTGDYAAVSNVWLRGVGQGGTGATVNGSRGVWIGLSNASSTRSDYCRVENCRIDQFEGNGISGEYRHAKIIYNVVRDNTDANIFCPTGRFNLFHGNFVDGSRGSGFDINGGYNIITKNYCGHNGGILADTSAWNGILLAHVDDSNPCSFNLVEGNILDSNLGAGVCVYGATGSVTTPGTGNIVRGNISTGHTNLTGAVHLPAGFWIVGTNNTQVEGNLSYLDRDGYLVSGSGGLATGDVRFVNNWVISATRNGYYAVYSPRVDLAGNNPAARVFFINNNEKASGLDGYRFEQGSVDTPFSKYVIHGNSAVNTTSISFRSTLPTAMTDFDFSANTSSGSTFQMGFGPAVLTANSTTIDISNSRLKETANSNPTTVATLTGGTIGIPCTIKIGDANTTFDFSGTAIKGNAGVDFAFANGDTVNVVFDGTNYNCTIVRSA